MERGRADGQRLTVDEYLATPETNLRYELVYGVVREPPAPSWNHQKIVSRLYDRLQKHVTKLQLGEVAFAPLDVILDAERHLIVQPDIVFVSTARSHIIRDRLWGAPDLAVEVLSAGSRRYVRNQKREWYRLYGVREQWLVDPVARTVEIARASVLSGTTQFEQEQLIRSALLPRIRLRVASIFAG